MENLEFKVFASDWDDFKMGDAVWIQKNGNDRYISVSNTGNTTTDDINWKYKIIDDDVTSLDLSPFSAVGASVYKISELGATPDSGHIMFLVNKQAVYFFVLFNGKPPLTPRSGSGGGLMK
jgi:hypothetical protein